MIELLTFLTANKVILVGAAGTIAELIVIVVNLVRKLKANKTRQVAIMDADEQHKPAAKISTLLWSCNPVNLFRKP